MADKDTLSTNENQGEIVIYQTDDGDTKIDVRFVDETVWLTQQQMAELFQSSRTNIVEHIQHIYEEGELDENSNCRKFRQVRTEGNRQVVRELPYYNLDMIISLGYRVKSIVATNFRRWATERLKEYMIKGFTMDDERMKNLGGGNYRKELLDRIRDIRSSEKDKSEYQKYQVQNLSPVEEVYLQNTKQIEKEAKRKSMIKQLSRERFVLGLSYIVK